MNDLEYALANILKDIINITGLDIFDVTEIKQVNLYEIQIKHKLLVEYLFTTKCMKRLQQVFKLNNINYIMLPENEESYATKKYYLTNDTVVKLKGLHALGGIKK